MYLLIQIISDLYSGDNKRGLDACLASLLL